MNRKQKIIISLTGIFLVLLILGGLTYAYFLTRIQGNTNTRSISLSTADLSIVYGDGNQNIITKEKIQPGTVIGEKDFTVTNEGNSEADYIVVIDDVVITNVSTEAPTTFSSNDFVYTLTCVSKNKNTDEVSGTCDEVGTETQLPLTNNGLLVANKIAENIRHEYVLTVTYKDTNIDQSADMNKSLEAKVDIKDIKQINPYSSNQNSLAYKIIDNSIKKTNGTELRNMSLTKPAEEITMQYIDGVLGEETTKNYILTRTISNASNIYFTYGDKATCSTYSGNCTISNRDNSALQAVILSENYETIIGKYIVGIAGSTSSTPASGTNLYTIHYVTNATSDSISYITYNNGAASNEKYITYGDSYEFDKTRGAYTIVNEDGSALKTIKYSEGYNSTLVNKYIVSTDGVSSSTPANATNKAGIYKVTSNSTATQIAYKTLTKSSTVEDLDNTLSVTKDDYGTSYYFRGNVIDNYVDFAGMCWRIVRIEGDGSIKIILEDQDSTCATSDGNWNIPTTTGGNTKTGNFGYTQYASGTLTASNGTTNSNVRTIIDYLNGETNKTKSMATAFKNFQTGTVTTNIASNYGNATLNNYLKIDNWCMNDKGYSRSGSYPNYTYTELSNNEMLDRIVNDSTFYYDSYVRHEGKAVTTPTLKCNGTVMNKFGDNTTDMYVGALTVDELVYAGGKINQSNPSFYLINGQSLSFYVLSPQRYTGIRVDRVYYFTSTLYIGEADSNANLSFRPAVTLKSGATISGGVGTKTNPYVIN